MEKEKVFHRRRATRSEPFRTRVEVRYLINGNNSARAYK